MQGNGKIVVQCDENLMEFQVNKGDIFRVCRTKDESIKDWVKLA
eukprot:gene29804-30277_t